MIQKILLCFISILAFSGCIPEKNDITKSFSGKYAQHFSLMDYDNFKLLEIHDPWQKAQEIRFRYCLAKKPDQIPDTLKGVPFIQVPVENTIVFSTTHVGFLKALGMEKGICGASGAKYIFDPDLAHKNEKGELAEVGYPPSINYEKIMELNPDLIYLYGIESSISNISKRIESTGISTVIIADFLEPHPLGKAEWIKVFASFYEKDKEADSLFLKIEEQYLQTRDRVKKTISEKPTVFLGLPWKDTWYMAGGSSFIAKLIEDAGGYYLWSDNSSEEYIPLSVEAVINRALHADIWLNPGSVRKLDAISGRDARYDVFDAYIHHHVYNNDKQLSAKESNNYWEEGVVEPHLILKDMVKIFHPGIMTDHEFVYYRKID